jgi:hypothetical protein
MQAFFETSGQNMDNFSTQVGPALSLAHPPLLPDQTLPLSKFPSIVAVDHVD